MAVLPRALSLELNIEADHVVLSWNQHNASRVLTMDKTWYGTQLQLTLFKI